MVGKDLGLQRSFEFHRVLRKVTRQVYQENCWWWLSFRLFTKNTSGETTRMIREYESCPLKEILFYLLMIKDTIRYYNVLYDICVKKYLTNYPTKGILVSNLKI